MVNSFFWIKQQTVDKHNVSAAAHNNDPKIMLLSGPTSCGKTSLMFQFAVNTVLEQGRNMVFICNKCRLENKPPFLCQGLDPSSNIFTRIQMKYVEDDEGIKKYFAAFHIEVIIDDFGELFVDTNCKQRYGGNYRGRHLVVDNHLGDTPRSLFIYKRWVPSIFTIKPGDASASYVLNNITSSNGASITSSTGATVEALVPTAESVAGRKKTAGCAKFSIALQYLMLEDIY
ncbi:hypothetical protein MKW92_004755 [Papaver armeniacum]|nr:hypothetical protein MKW92_004755 [Papaver armeniacum]